MDTTTDNRGNRWQDSDRAKMAVMMQEAYARVWYELCVALALRSGCVVAFAGHSARKAHVYRVREQDQQSRTHIVYHFFEQRRFSCTCQRSEARHLPCAHVGATVLFLQSLAQSAE
ncbi:MAG: SWIM zinc finger family protein [Ktedonobacterales bacterium]